MKYDTIGAFSGAILPLCQARPRELVGSTGSEAVATRR